LPEKLHELEANQAKPYRRLLFFGGFTFCAADRCFFDKFISMKVLTEKEIDQACELTLASLYKVNPLWQFFHPILLRQNYSLNISPIIVSSTACFLVIMKQKNS
jgi:hypothetical protein